MIFWDSSRFSRPGSGRWCARPHLPSSAVAFHSSWDDLRSRDPCAPKSVGRGFGDEVVGPGSTAIAVLFQAGRRDQMRAVRPVLRSRIFLPRCNRPCPDHDPEDQVDGGSWRSWPSGRVRRTVQRPGPQQPLRPAGLSFRHRRSVCVGMAKTGLRDGSRDNVDSMVKIGRGVIRSGILFCSKGDPVAVPRIEKKRGPWPPASRSGQGPWRGLRRLHHERPA